MMSAGTPKPENPPSAAEAPQNHPNRASMTAWIEKLGSKNIDEVLEAEKALERIGGGAISALLSAIRREKRVHRAQIGLYMVALTVLAACNVATMVQHKRLHVSDWMWTARIGIVVLAVLFTVSDRRKSATRLLANLQDLRALPALLEARRFATLRATVDAALKRMLPSLRPGDASLVGSREREVLYRLTAGEDIDLALAALRAFEQVGNASDIPYVQSLAEAPSQAFGDQRLRNAARACLQCLREHAKQENLRQTLLRPTTAPAAETLLRPAVSTIETPPEQLLRATDAGGPREPSPE